MKKRVITLRCAALLLGLFIACAGWSQNAKVTLTMQPKSLKTLLSEIEKQTNYRFSYDTEAGKKQIQYTPGL